MALKFFNTLTRKKETLRPLQARQVRMYSCGPTVYNYAHLGNLRTYIFTDLLKRVLMVNGYRVRHIMNITDVGHLTAEATDSGEDKLEAGAVREGKTVWEIAVFYTQAFQEDAKKLNILPPSRYVKATDHIKEQVALIRQLFTKGYAYDTPEVVYFDTAQFKHYGRLARLQLRGLKPGARVRFDVRKRNVTDFALWFKTVGAHKNHIMRWPAPWGEGFPGWHVECSAMARKHLRQPFDIHTGGVDHIPIHHTNEIAQSEAAYGKPLARYWLHGEFLVLGKPGRAERMGKSLNNLLTLRALEEQGVEPLAFRYLCLTAHYRSKLYFTLESVRAAGRALVRLQEAATALPVAVGRAKLPLEKKFLAAINNDLDIPRALSLVWEMLRSRQYSPAQKRQHLLSFDAVFGLGLGEPTRVGTIVPEEVAALVVERARARASKYWQRADELRQQVEELGYCIDDTAEGSRVVPRSSES